jgi:hypothetical protein
MGELLEAMISVGPFPRLYHEDKQEKPVGLETFESAVSSWEADPSELSQRVAPGGGAPIFVSRFLAMPC